MKKAQEPGVNPPFLQSHLSRLTLQRRCQRTSNSEGALAVLPQATRHRFAAERPRSGVQGCNDATVELGSLGRTETKVETC